MRHADLIEALGGAAAVQRYLRDHHGAQISADSVRRWKERGMIPHQWRGAIAAMAADSGQWSSLPPQFIAGVTLCVIDQSEIRRASQ